jgi:hypothetical protein
MRQMRTAVLHLGDARVGIVRMPPIFVAALFRAPAIQSRQIRPRGRLDTRRLGEPRQKLLIGLARVAAHDAPQRGIGLERRRIDANGLALDEILRRQHLKDPREHVAVRLQIDQAARPRDRRVIRRRLLEAQSQEAPQRQGIGGPPRNAALRIDALEVPDQQQPEVRARRQTRAPHGRGV